MIRYVLHGEAAWLSCESGFNSKSVLINILIISPPPSPPPHTPHRPIPTQTSDFSTNVLGEADGVWAANRTSRLIIHSRIRRAPVSRAGRPWAFSSPSTRSVYRINRGSATAVNNVARRRCGPSTAGRIVVIRIRIIRTVTRYRRLGIVSRRPLSDFSSNLQRKPG